MLWYKHLTCFISGENDPLSSNNFPLDDWGYPTKRSIGKSGTLIMLDSPVGLKKVYCVERNENEAVTARQPCNGCCTRGHWWKWGRISTFLLVRPLRGRRCVSRDRYYRADAISHMRRRVTEGGLALCHAIDWNTSARRGMPDNYCCSERGRAGLFHTFWRESEATLCNRFLLKDPLIAIAPASQRNQFERTFFPYSVW